VQKLLKVSSISGHLGPAGCQLSGTGRWETVGTGSTFYQKRFAEDLGDSLECFVFIHMLVQEHARAIQGFGSCHC
jgi:hypothetical protein